MTWESGSIFSLAAMSFYFLYFAQSLSKDHETLKLFLTQMSFFGIIGMLGLSYQIVVDEPLATAGIRDNVGIMYSVMMYILIGWIAYWFLFIMYRIYQRLWGNKQQT